MKTTKMLTILVLALGLMVGLAQVSQAGPMGTAFTYQGRLMDANDTAQGIYDMMYHIYDSPEGPNEIGVTDLQDVEIVDGYFTVELGFDVELFSGDWRWLEISIRPGDSNDPDGYIPLNPRQQITPTPYALYARRAGIEVPFSLTGSTDVEWIIGATNNGNGPALGGVSTSGYGVRGQSTSGYSVLGTNTGGNYGYLGGSDYGVYGQHAGSGNTGFLGSSSYGVYGSSSSDAGYAGYFSGRGYFSDNVGIGTTSPSQALEVEGDNPRILVDATSSNPELNLRASGKTIWSMYQDASTGDLRFYQAGDKITFQNGTGNVGIGTADPNGTFHVSAGGRANALVVSSTTGNVGIGTADPMGWGAYQGVMHVAGPYMPSYVLESTKAGYERKWVTSADDGFLKIREASAGFSSSFQIGPNGHVGIGGLYYAAYRLAVSGDIAYTGDILHVSDLRLKENITPLENAVEKVCSIRGIYFNNKGESQDKREVGVIAQEVETVLPEAVSEDEEGYKWVGYSKLTPLLIEAVKELKAENEQLKEQLERQNKLLTRRLEALEAKVQRNEVPSDKEVQL